MGLTSKFSDKERESDTDWSNESAFVLLGCEHEDREDEFSGEEHLDEEALHDGCATAEVGADCERAGEES